MSREVVTFHPDLDPDESLRNFAQETSRYYSSIDKIPEPNIRRFDHSSGSWHTGFISTPNDRFTPVTEISDRLLVVHYPFGHAVQNGMNVALTTQLLADATGTPVFNIPNSNGTQTSDHISFNTRKRASKIGATRALAEVHANSVIDVAQSYSGDEPVDVICYSEGASRGPATAEACKNELAIGGVGVYGSPSVVERSFPQLVRTFMQPNGGESRESVIERAGIGALDNIHGDTRTFLLGALGITLAGNRKIEFTPGTLLSNVYHARALGHATVKSCLTNILEAQPESRAHIAVASLDDISPAGANQDLASSLKASFPGRVDMTMLSNVGHQAGSNPYDLLALSLTPIRKAQAARLRHAA